MRLASALGRLVALAPLMAGVWAAGASAAMTPEPVAVMQGIDKITARVSRFEAPVGEQARFGTLSIRVRDCERSPPEERPENAAFVEITEDRPGEEKQRLFSGWMFSSSPALSALEHPVYDVNLLACKAASGSPPPVPPPPPPAPKSPGRSRGKTAR